MLVHALRHVGEFFGREKLFDEDVSVFFPVLDIFLSDQVGVSSLGLLRSVSALRSIVENRSFESSRTYLE